MGATNPEVTLQVPCEVTPGSSVPVRVNVNGGGIFGEQVASKDGLAWFDVVSADLEGEDYAIGAADLCAAGFGAPHIRSRLYFVAQSDRERPPSEQLERESRPSEAGDVTARSAPCRVADAKRNGGGPNEPGRGSLRREIDGRDCEAGRVADAAEFRGGAFGQTGGNGAYGANGISRGGLFSGVANTEEQRCQGDRPEDVQGQRNKLPTQHGYTNGFWADAEWLWCRDQKYRPVEPGTFPLVTGAANRVGRLRGYGNALCAEVAKGFIESYLEVRG